MGAYLKPTAYLPHRPPLCLLDEVMAVNDKSVVCRVSNRCDSCLDVFKHSDGSCSTTVLVELMAQTIGVWAGYQRILSNNAKLPTEEQDAEVGLLLSARGLKILTDQIKANAELIITMHLLIDESRLTSFEGNVTMDGKEVAAGRLTVFQPTNQELANLFDSKRES